MNDESDSKSLSSPLKADWNPQVSADTSSPPCFAHQAQDNFFGRNATKEETANNVARWRCYERQRLIKARMAIPTKQRREAARHVMWHLNQFLELQINPPENVIISLYWPFRGELNLRKWMADTHERGYQIALPTVQSKTCPLLFRKWSPTTRLVPDVWKIPIPLDGELVTPTVVIAPLVGVDRQGYRLGYGGGFFDRTLASFATKQCEALVIGVGHSTSQIQTIYPQAHDVPMNWVMTENGSNCINTRSVGV